MALKGGMVEDGMAFHRSGDNLLSLYYYAVSLGAYTRRKDFLSSFFQRFLERGGEIEPKAKKYQNVILLIRFQGMSIHFFNLLMIYVSFKHQWWTHPFFDGLISLNALVSCSHIHITIH